MEISQILQQPEGFTPPDVTVRITKVHPRKAGENNNGPWSFQNVEVEGGRLKLKTLPEFPKAREGQTVTLRANQSKQHGLTGMKVNHEQYNGNIYHQILVTNSCKWEFAQNGSQPTPQNGAAPTQNRPESIQDYIDHLLSVAALSNQITAVLGIGDDAAMQACFATLCIDTKNRGLMLPKTLPAIVPGTASAEQGDPYENAPRSIVDDSELPEDYQDEPLF